MQGIAAARRRGPQRAPLLFPLLQPVQFRDDLVERSGHRCAASRGSERRVPHPSRGPEPRSGELVDERRWIVGEGESRVDFAVAARRDHHVKQRTAIDIGEGERLELYLVLTGEEGASCQSVTGRHWSTDEKTL